MVKQFDELIDSEDTAAIGGFMDALSKSAGKFFESGIGFDGIVYSEEDKAVLQGQLDDLKGSMPVAQRIAMKNALQKSGIIPDFNSVVKPQPLKHVPRTKKMHDF